MAILVRSTELLAKEVQRLTDSLNAAGAKSEDLSNKIFRLNQLLTVATVVGAIATAVAAYPVAAKLGHDGWRSIKAVVRNWGH